VTVTSLRHQAPPAVSAAALRAEEERKARARLLAEAGSSVYWTNLSEDEREVLRDAFGRIDRNHDGHITTTELHDYYQKTIGDDLTVGEVLDMMNEADIDHNAKIELGEFADITIRAKNNAGTSLKWKKIETLFHSELDRASKRQRR